MQQDLLFGDDPASTVVAIASPKKAAHPDMELRTITASESTVTYRVSNCPSCGGSGACFARSNRSKQVPCLRCGGRQKIMRFPNGQFVPFRMMEALMKDPDANIEYL